MRVLFATSDGADYLASCLWDGLQEVLGWENVYDAGNNADFHSLAPSVKNPDEGPVPLETTANVRICGTRYGKHFSCREENFDLLVLNACFLRQHDWHWALRLRERLAPGGKVAFVEGWDSAHEVHDPAAECQPAFKVDAVFRREYATDHAYPYGCHHLDFAAPLRWFEMTEKEERERDINIYFAGSLNTHPVRGEMVDTLAQSRLLSKSLLATDGVLTHQQHMSYLRRSKIALCPPGAATCNCLRAWEVLATGATPVFVGHPENRARNPWLKDGGMHGWVGRNNVDLPGMINFFLNIPAADFAALRQQRMEWCKQHHTTAARARKLLEITMG